MEDSDATAGTITFLVRNGEFDYGNARNICFGCGDTASEKTTIYFENTERFGKIGTAMSLLDRKTINIPVCKKCKNIIWTYRKKILLWAVVFVMVLLAGIFIMNAFKVNLDKHFWPMLIVLGAGAFPMYMARKYWILKDRGGNVVDLIDATDSSLTLKFSNLKAYELIAKDQ